MRIALVRKNGALVYCLGVLFLQTAAVHSRVPCIRTKGMHTNDDLMVQVTFAFNFDVDSNMSILMLILAVILMFIIFDVEFNVDSNVNFKVDFSMLMSMS
jgi:hypothetical protein